MVTVSRTSGRACARRQSPAIVKASGAIRDRSRLGAIFVLLVSMLAFGGAGAEAADAYGLSVSSRSDRADAVTLGGQTYQQSSVIYVFTQPDAGVVNVRFYLDDPTRSNGPRISEYLPPYDFAGTANDGRAKGFSVGALPSGNHTITAAVRKTDGQTQVISATFSVASNSSLLFEDNFNGTSLDTTKWGAYDSIGHGGNGYRRPSAITVSNGMLTVTGKMVDGKIVSGGMAQRSNYTYGRYEFRVRTELDPTGTMSGVVMTWPKNQWSPEFTENDIYETGTSSTSRRPFKTFIHYGYTYSTQKIFSHDADASQWHTMVMDWRWNAIKIYRDGVLVWTMTDTAAIPDVLHHYSIQLDARATRTLTAPVRMYVDYVRIYR